MKRILLIVSLTLIQVVCFGQKLNQKVGSNPTVLHTSAALEVESTSKGFLPPRMTQSQMNAVSNPATGLLVYCTNCSTPGLYVYNGSSWTESSTNGNNNLSITTNCSNTNGFIGAYISGSSLTGNYFNVSINNNSLSAAGPFTFTSSDLQLTGITGLTIGNPTPTTATINPGNSLTISYPITGTPATTGNLNGNWNKLSLNCSNTKIVGGLAEAINDANFCTNASINGTFVSGVAMTSANTFTITLTNNSGSQVNGFPAPSMSNLTTSWNGTGSLNVSAVNPSTSFNLANGASQTITYTLSGTPSSSGTLTLDWLYGGFTCQKIKNISIGDATFLLPQSKYAISINDGNPIINIQGYISNNTPNQFVINVPYTGGLGNYNAYTSNVVNSSAGEGGDINGFSITYPSGTFNSSGNIPVTVIIDGDGTYSAKKKIFGASEIIATLPFRINGDYRGDIIIGVTGGIPDRMYGIADNNGNTNSHNFIYTPITAPDGKIWLSNNLGANYANMNHPNFNPVQQATSATDHHAYGSLFQWGRKADGHELINWTNSTTGTPVNSVSTILNNTPTNALFITNNTTPFDWRSSSNTTLWTAESSANNPCPQGYRVPTQTEFINLVTQSGITNASSAASSILKFTLPGFRINFNGNIGNIGTNGYYWSTTLVGISVNIRAFGDAGTSAIDLFRSSGLSIRCIKD